MSGHTFVLIPGAGGVAAYWHLLAVEFQRLVARERLGIDADEVSGGHLAVLGYPVELATRLLAYAAQRPQAPP